MGLYEGAEEILAASDSTGSVVVEFPDRTHTGDSFCSFHLYVILASIEHHYCRADLKTEVALWRGSLPHCELLDRNTFNAYTEAERAVNEFINGCYNICIVGIQRRVICCQLISSGGMPSAWAGLCPQM